MVLTVRVFHSRTGQYHPQMWVLGVFQYSGKCCSALSGVTSFQSSFLHATVRIQQLHMFHLKLINYGTYQLFSYQETYTCSNSENVSTFYLIMSTPVDNMGKMNSVISITVFFLYQYVIIFTFDLSPSPLWCQGWPSTTV